MTKFSSRGTTSTPVTSNPDFITVLTTQPGYFASKVITRTTDGHIDIQNFNAGLYFAVLDLPAIDGIHTLSNYLTQLEAIPNALVIRGRPLSHIAQGTWVFRRKVNFLTPDDGHRWVMIDIDKYPLPKRLVSKRNSHAAIEYLVTKLPAEFHDTTYHWAFSSSAARNSLRKRPTSAVAFW